MIALIQIANTEIFACIAVLVFKYWVLKLCLYTEKK